MSTPRPATARIAFVTCAALPALVADDLLLAAAADGHGIEAVPCVWDDPDVAWETFDGCLVRSAWDYHLRRDAFTAWSRQVAAAVPLWNGPDVIAWNTDKRYLRDFAAAGVPVVPTAWAARGASLDLAALLAERGWEEAIVKPAVGMGSSGISRVRDGDVVAGGAIVSGGGPISVPSGAVAAQAALDALLAQDDVLVQPFAPSVLERGELSLIFFEGAFSHAIRKRPRNGDFRVQTGWGGTIEPARAGAAARAVAEQALAQLDGTPLYARVDLLEENVDAPWLIELELVDPVLYFGEDPAAAQRLARALRPRLDAR
jgi:glutathione synthase/RimK-type ligase-like ATP-grasp enzyme